MIFSTAVTHITSTGDERPHVHAMRRVKKSPFKIPAIYDSKHLIEIGRNLRKCFTDKL